MSRLKLSDCQSDATDGLTSKVPVTQIPNYEPYTYQLEISSLKRFKQTEKHFVETPFLRYCFYRILQPYSLIIANQSPQPNWGIAAEKRKAEKALQGKPVSKAKAKGKAKAKAAAVPTWGEEEDVPDEWPSDEDVNEDQDGEELESGDEGL